MKYKLLILAESAANPRSFPVSEVTQLEETYPYLIRIEFKDSTFWQLSFGNISTEQLLSQAIAYLSHWSPDIIIIHSGLNDCRPEAFTEFQKAVINKLAGPFFGKIKKYVFHPALIKRRQVYRVSKRRFRKTIKKFKLIFPQSKIFWLGICAGSEYEKTRPGVNNRMKDDNKSIEEIYGNDCIKIQEKMLEINGFNVDNLHWNKRGHAAVADILLERINLFLGSSKPEMIETP